MKLNTIAEAIADLKKGKGVIVVDDPHRENQGDIVFAAQYITTAKINFLIQECGGLICAPITAERALALEIPLMVAPENNTEQTCINFTVSVDAKGVTDHGISAKDRALTGKLLVSDRTKANDLARPGHIFPLIAAAGGLKQRQGHTEATIELLNLARLKPIGIICEILKTDGTMARLPQLKIFAKKYDLKIITIADLIKTSLSLRAKRGNPESVSWIASSTRNDRKNIVLKTASAPLPTKFGDFKLTVFRSLVDNKEHVALAYGNIKKNPVLTRIHSMCLTGDTFSSLRCDCQDQLHASMARIAHSGSGLILYLNQEGRGIGLTNKIKAYALQDKGMDTVQANEALGFKDDERGYDIAAAILHELKITSVNLLTNNPRKIKGLEASGIRVEKRVSLEIASNAINKEYLATKKTKLGHQIG